jgi:hypothetical protein
VNLTLLEVALVVLAVFVGSGRLVVFELYAPHCAFFV